MQVGEIFDTVGGFIALGALLGVLLAAAALPLAAPRRPPAAGAGWSASPSTRRRISPTSEKRLDHAETELEEFCRGDRDRGARADGDPGRRDSGRDPGHPRAPGARADHDGARGAGSRTRAGAGSSTGSTQPRVLVAIGAAALLLGAGGDLRLPAAALRRRGPAAARTSARIDPADVNGRGAQRHLDQRARRQGRLRHRGAPATRSVAITNTDARLQARPRCSTRTAEAGGAEGRRRPRGRGEDVKPLDRDLARAGRRAPTWS